MANPSIAMQVAIFLASLLNWWSLIGSLHELRKMGYPLQMLYVFFDGLPVLAPLFIKWFSQIKHKTRQGDLRREQALANKDYDEYGDDEDYEDDEDESSL